MGNVVHSAPSEGLKNGFRLFSFVKYENSLYLSQFILVKINNVYEMLSFNIILSE